MTAYLSDVPHELINGHALSDLLRERRRANPSGFPVQLRYGPGHGQLHHVPSSQHYLFVLSTTPRAGDHVHFFSYGDSLIPSNCTPPRRVEYVPSSDYTLPELYPVWVPVGHKPRKRKARS